MLIYQKPKINYEYKLGKTCCRDLFKELGNSYTFYFDRDTGTLSLESGRLGLDRRIQVPIHFCPFCGERINILKIDKNTEDTLKELKIIG